MKTDADLKREVEAELAWDPAVNANAIGVAVKDGVVTLSGHIDTYPEKWAAERALRRVRGVKALALELDVRLSPDHQRSDTDIALAAESALKWNSAIPPDSVRLTVDKGWITLRGELDWDYQRKSIEKSLRHLTGVIGISDEIGLHYRPVPGDISRRIREALTRQSEREARHLDIDVSGDTVTLRGQVHSWHERDAAWGAAWSAPGVAKVIDELTIG
ncbi:BON domain-containing protein [Ideonella sp. YS5]|uniref:BON domain-containing protein n=1 Tax=Ideonella sp. YS5 TaxID=3453714 RepID=UPI003EECE191